MPTAIPTLARDTMDTMPSTKKTTSQVTNTLVAIPTKKVTNTLTTPITRITSQDINTLVAIRKETNTLTTPIARTTNQVTNTLAAILPIRKVINTPTMLNTKIINQATNMPLATLTKVKILVLTIPNTRTISQATSNWLQEEVVEEEVVEEEVEIHHQLQQPTHTQVIAPTMDTNQAPV